MGLTGLQVSLFDGLLVVSCLDSVWSGSVAMAKRARGMCKVDMERSDTIDAVMRKGFLLLNEYRGG